MPLLEYRLADAASTQDDADLRHLLRVNPLPGDIHLTYEREPSFWAAGADAAMQQTMIVRAQDGRTVGMGSRSVRDLYVNGTVQRVGYLSQMRVDSTFAWGLALPKALAQGWRFVRALQEGDATPYDLVSLVAEDNVATRMMTLGLPGWPALHAVGGLLTYAVQVRRGRGVPRLDAALRLRNAREDDRAAIADCLARNGVRRQFTPVWHTDLLDDPRTTPDLAMADFWLVERGDRVVGTLARWNQRRFKQTVVRGYAPHLARWRPVVNALAWSGLSPRLPAVGEQLRHAFASHLAVDNDDPQVAAALLAAVYNSAVRAGDDYLMVGLDPDHPFTPLLRRYRRVVYATQLYLATWGDAIEAARAVTGRQMGAEIALL